MNIKKIYKNAELAAFTLTAAVLAVFIIIAAINSPRRHLNQEFIKPDAQSVYQNIGVATKAMFFHEMKKTRY